MAGMTFDQIKTKMDELSRRHAAATTKRATFQGQLDAKKQELLKLKREIEEAGFDPKNLKGEMAKLETELVTMIAQYEQHLSEVEKALSEHEAK